jgi:hypothetical protein
MNFYEDEVTRWVIGWIRLGPQVRIGVLCKHNTLKIAAAMQRPTGEPMWICGHMDLFGCAPWFSSCAPWFISEVILSDSLVEAILSDKIMEKNIKFF